MQKMKSHGGISKNIKVRKSGSNKIGHVEDKHNSGKKATDFNRKARKGSVLSTGDAKRYKGLVK